MTLQVISTNLRTGRVIADLASCVIDYPLRRTIGQYEIGTAKLYMDGAPENWQDAVLEGGAVLHLYDDQDPAMTPQWSGIVTRQVRNGATDVVELSLATGESYLDRRYVGDVTYVGLYQSAIVSDLMTRFVADSTGVPFTTRIIAGGVDTQRDRTYLEVDNATVYSRLQQLMAVKDGIEFTVEWEWSVDRQSIRPVLMMGRRIGTGVTAGLAPSTTWDMPGVLVDCQQVRDYSSGKGANDVTAYSSGQGASTPKARRLWAGQDDRPCYQFRWSPSSSITNTSALDFYARQAVGLMGSGSVTLTLVAARAAAPRYGVDWVLGDTLGYSIGGINDHGVETVPTFPGGIGGTGRCIAYEVSESLVTPILAQAEIYSGEYLSG